MQIPWTLVWFGVLGPQDRAPNLGVDMEIKYEKYTLLNSEKLLQEKRSGI